MGAWKGLDEGGHEVIRYFGPGEEAHARAQGFVPASTAEAAQATGAIDDQTGGALGAIGATVSSGLSGATLGLSDVALRGLLSDSEMGRLAADRAAHPALSTAGTLAGAALAGGTAAPAGLAGSAGAAVGEGLGGGLLGAVGGGAAEGVLYGAGQGVSDLALSDDPLTIEHAASAISSNALYGAGLGAVAGGALHGVERGLTAAKGALDDALLNRSAERAMKAVSELDAEAAANPPAIGPDTDVSLLDKQGLKAAREQETERIEAARVPERQQFVSDLGKFYDDMAEQKLSKTVTGVDDAEARRAGAALKSADFRLRKLTDNEIGLAENPQRALDALQTQKQALLDIESWQDEAQGNFWHEVKQTKAQLYDDLMAGKLEGYRGDALTPAGRDLAVNQELQRRFKVTIDSDGFLAPPPHLSVERWEQIKAAIDRNTKLQEQLARITAEPTSERLSQIEQAEQALGVRTAPPKETHEGSPIGAVLKLAAHAAGGPLGGVAVKAAGALGGLKAAAGAAAERAGRAASNFLGKAAPAVGKAAPAATVLATKVLSELRYGDRSDDGEPTPAREPKTLPELYKARTDEIKQQVQIAPDGTFQMRPAARQVMAAKLAGLGAIDPVAADRLETAGAKRIAWLASQIPRRPDLADVQIGPDNWHPSDMEMRAFARKAAAAEDLPAVLERVVHGTVTPEDAMAMRALGPEMMNQFINEVTAELPTLRKTLPYERLLSMSLFTGQPLVPELDPRIVSFLQAQFPTEPGTAGGTQAPRAMPQFGSIKNSLDKPTPAQTRSQGAHV